MPDPVTISLILLALAPVGYGLWNTNRKLNQLQALHTKSTDPPPESPNLQVGNEQFAEVKAELRSLGTKLDRTPEPVVIVPTPSVAEQSAPGPGPLEIGQTLSIGTNSLANMLELSRIAPAQKQGRGLALTPDSTAKFGHLLEGMLGEAGRTALAQAGTYIVKFSPDVVRALKDGTMEMVKNENGLRATARAVQGKAFTANATLETPSLLGSPASAVLLAWQAAAIITAQKYLADIDQKLNVLQSQMTEVLDWLADQERGALLGNYHYLSRVRTALDSQNYSELELNEYSAQLEHIDRECLQVQHSALERLKRFKADVDGHAQKKISAELATTEVSQAAENCTRALHVILMTLQIRSLTLELKAATSVSQNGLQYRLDQLKSDYSALQATFKECFEPLTQVPQLDNWISFAEKKKQYETYVSNLKLKAEKDFDAVIYKKDQQLSHLERTLKAALKQKIQPLTLEVQVGEGGRLIAVEPCVED